MDWQLAIHKNREALLRIISVLCAGFVDASPSHISAELRCTILRVLRPAESAVRRLIIIAAWGIQLSPSKTTCALPDFSKLHRGTSDQPPRFKLYDQRKRFDFSSTQKSELSFHPRISVPGIMAPLLQIAVSHQQKTPSAKPIFARLAALNHALENIPKQAKRLARAQARRRQLPAGPKRVPPMRPGMPPGFRKRPIHEIDEILQECHGLARDLSQASQSEATAAWQQTRARGPTLSATTYAPP